VTALLVANNGGHVKQLHSLAPRLGFATDRVWVTVRAPQTTALLRDEEVVWVDYPDARDLGAVLRHARAVSPVFRRRRIETVVSTGASLALSVLPQAAARGIDARYIESATRFEGPSMAGRLLARVPRIAMYTQYEHLADRRWRFGGSVFDGFTAERVPGPAPSPLRVVVTVGSTGAYGFRRLLDRVVQVLPEHSVVTWQTGSTDVAGLELRGVQVQARATMPADELAAEVAAADVVIAHAGTGSALGALEAGRLPLLVPRRVEHGEHVDGHQGEIARMLEQRQLALVREADELTRNDLDLVATSRVRRTFDPPAFRW